MKLITITGVFRFFIYTYNTIGVLLFSVLFILIIGFTFFSNRYVFHLKGHSSDESKIPPDITLVEGQRVLAVEHLPGFDFMPVPPPYLTSNNTNIVDVEIGDHSTYIVARESGETQLTYTIHPKHLFTVKVFEK